MYGKKCKCDNKKIYQGNWFRIHLSSCGQIFTIIKCTLHTQLLGRDKNFETQELRYLLIYLRELFFTVTLSYVSVSSTSLYTSVYLGQKECLLHYVTFVSIRNQVTSSINNETLSSLHSFTCSEHCNTRRHGRAEWDNQEAIKQQT